jgi:hypothetical protein
MKQATVHQYVKLGSNLEFLRGICSVSMMQTTSLAPLPNLMANLPPDRYSAMHVAEVLRSLLIQLAEMGLGESLRDAEPFRPMLTQIEDYLSQVKSPQEAHLNDPFAERLVAIAKRLASAVRKELGTAASRPGPATEAHVPGA